MAKKAVETSEAVVILFDDLTNTEQAKKIHQLETEADVLTRDIFSELNRTFITPLDREDMQRIASKIDDVIYFMDGIAARVYSLIILIASLLSNNSLIASRYKSSTTCSISLVFLQC